MPRPQNGTLAVLDDQLVKSAQLLNSGRMNLQDATFPARPGVGRDLEQPRRLGLGECAERASEVHQVQFSGAGRTRSIRHV
jgi:hypothetical protein